MFKFVFKLAFELAFKFVIKFATSLKFVRCCLWVCVGARGCSLVSIGVSRRSGYLSRLGLFLTTRSLDLLVSSLQP